ncbi:MAG: NUDIX hydrolase [Myxococcota bacterium]
MIGSIERALRAHEASDPREAVFVEQMLELLTTGDPTGRAQFSPGHFTASAFVTSPDGASVLLVHHGKLHRWLQPGGHIEPGDPDLFAAARREVAEEVGLVDLDLPDGEVLLDVDVHEIPPLRGDPPHRHFDLRIHLRALGAAFRAGSDALAARWVPLTELARAAEAEGSDESVARAARRLLAHQGRAGYRSSSAPIEASNDAFLASKSVIRPAASATTTLDPDGKNAIR